jgi:hypothetical protein
MGWFEQDSFEAQSFSEVETYNVRIKTPSSKWNIITYHSYSYFLIIIIPRSIALLSFRPTDIKPSIFLTFSSR